MIRVGAVTIDQKRFAVKHGDTEVLFPGYARPRTPAGKEKYEPFIAFRLLKHLLVARPSTRMEIFDALYGYREDGGPLYGEHIIDIHIAQLKKRLVPLGLRVVSEKHCGLMRYWVDACP